MIYNFGTLGWYTAKTNRQYDNTDNQGILHHFVTDSLPAFQIVIDAVVSVATYILYDINDVSIKAGSCTVVSTTNAAGTAYSKIKLTGATTSGEDDGKYYYKVTYDAVDIYSDVFCWRTDVSSFLKITAVMAAASLSIGSFPLDLFTHTVYLDAILPSDEFELKVTGIEKTYGDIPAFASSNNVKTFEISGYNKTLNFLSRLPVVEINGTVTVTWNGDSVDIYDIQNSESKSTFGNDIYIIDFKFKQKDYLQSYNSI